MPGKKHIIFYLLTAFIFGALVLIYIQYNFTKNINSLTNGTLEYIDEYNLNTELRDVENDLVRIESNITDFVSTGDTEFIQGLDLRISNVQDDLDRLHKITDDEATTRLINSLDTVVHSKLAYGKMLLDTMHRKGKKAAEDIIKILEGKKLMDSIYSYTGQIKNVRHRIMNKLNERNIKSGDQAERLNYVLIPLILISAALLFWYIIYIIEKLIQSEKEVKEAVRINENFLANMSHEIRTPMNAILGFTALLEQRNLDEKSKEYVRIIQTSGENLLTIINDVLDLSKIEAGMMRIESVPFSIRDLLHSVEVMFAMKAAEKNLKLETYIEQSIPEILEGDITRLVQILINLIGNALKFTKKGSITIEVTNKGIEGKTIKTGITVRDTGLGIEKNKQQEIFNRFQQADDSVTRHFGGTGLGLSIVQELVILQNGTISVESEPGKSTAFHIEIPYTITENQNAVRKDLMVTPPGTFTDFTNKRILVVEDNEINQSLIKHLFGEWKLDYDLAQNGREALDILRKVKFDMILMDIQMPEMDGYTAAKEIRETIQLKTPIIAMTAHAMTGEREKCLSYGMNEYISKPIKGAQLHKLIAQFSNTNFDDVSRKEPRPLSSANLLVYINLEYMKEISGGNKKYEKEVTGQFIEAIPAALAAIEAAWSNKNIIELCQQVHNMKTTISIMGLTEALQPTLEKLEYEDLTPELFSAQFTLLQIICNGALAEAKEFYSSFN